MTVKVARPLKRLRAWRWWGLRGDGGGCEGDGGGDV